MNGLKSRYLKEFVKEIQFKNRNPKNLKVLEYLDDISTNPEINISQGEYLYRCRIINDKDKIGQEPNFYGFDSSGSFVPPYQYTRDMRANYRYIPYLYCSNNPYISLVEVRPRLGANVSIATIKVLDNIRLLDFTIQDKPTSMKNPKINFFDDISLLYSTPVTSDDDILDYIPTQFIAEYAKNLGYDGISFSSSLTPEIAISENRFNIVVFNYKKCIPIKSNVINITGNYYDAVKVDNDENGVEIFNYLSERLNNRLQGL